MPAVRKASKQREQVVRGAMYRGDDVVAELAHLVEEFRPTLVVMPHSGDQHPDHCATHLLVHDALSVALEHHLPAPRVLRYVVHFPDWPGMAAPGERADPPRAGARP